MTCENDPIMQDAPPFAELCALSNFTFLTGASHPEELVARAAALGVAAVAVADRNSLAGVVRAHIAAKALRRDGGSVRALVAARLVLQDSPIEWIALPTDRAAYARLCRLLTLGKRRADKGGCDLTVADLAAWRAGLILLALPPDPLCAPVKPADIARFGPEVYTVARPGYDGRDAERIAAIAALAKAADAPMIATADPIMHAANRRPLADVLTCIRTRKTVDSLGRLALPNAERRLKSGADLARMLFASWPEALSRTVAIAGRCQFSMDDLRYEYPDEVATDPDTGETLDPHARLRRLTAEGLQDRYPDGVPDRAQALADRELALIAKLDYARYFLTVHDIVAFARRRGILAQGRGSAANSVVCYALGITEVSPEVGAMVFERFVSEARDEPPDIDVDFEHERREEVIQHVYDRFGRHRAGLCATVVRFRARAAAREVGRAMGLSADVTAALSSHSWNSQFAGDTLDEAAMADRLRAIGLNPNDRRLRLTLRLMREIQSFPRHLSQHVGGMIITRGRLDELCPIENAAMADRTVIEWDKDDVEALGMMKIDVLALGMLTCLRKGLDLLAQHHGARHSLATLPKEDPAVYDMLSQGDSLGVFQVESRAQMNFLPRMKPERFYDLVIQVAIIRPGPIQGDMVHPYLRRRQGAEPVSYPSEELAGVLGRTLGVPLFQEQAMQVAITAAGFDPSEADRLRRSLAAFRKTGTVSDFRDRFITGMTARGYEPGFAERCFAQIEGFGEYGFPESHAASFALLVYASAWLKRWHPAVFACALLNAQPMGFYAPAQLVRDARAHGGRGPAGVRQRQLLGLFVGARCRRSGRAPRRRFGAAVGVAADQGAVGRRRPLDRRGAGQRVSRCGGSAAAGGGFRRLRRQAGRSRRVSGPWPVPSASAVGGESPAPRCAAAAVWGRTRRLRRF